MGGNFFCMHFIVEWPGVRSLFRYFFQKKIENVENKKVKREKNKWKECLRLKL